MVASGIGGIHTNQQPANIQSMQQQTRSEIKQEMAMIKEALNALKDLSEEIGGKMRTGMNKGELRMLDDSTTTAQLQKQQPPTTSAQHLSQDEEAALITQAALVAGLDDEEKDIKEKKKKDEFTKKMELLAKLENTLTEVDFDQPKHKEIMKEFFDNMNRINTLKKRLTHLEIREEKLEEELEKQKAFEEEIKEEKKGG